MIQPVITRLYLLLETTTCYWQRFCHTDWHRKDLKADTERVLEVVVVTKVYRQTRHITRSFQRWSLTLYSKLWSFLVTGTTGRHELKIWSTETWSCLQTVTLLVPPSVGLSSPASSTTALESYLQVGMDLSATYLILCDIARKVQLVIRPSCDQYWWCGGLLADWLVKY